MAMPLKFTVYKGSDVVDEHVFERDIIKIGRLPSAHLRLEDSKVSRIHAVIESSSGGTEYSVIDMGSTEGTYLNGSKISKEKLANGDELRLGNCRVLVSFDVSREAAQSAGQNVVADGDEWAVNPAEMALSPPTSDIGASADVPEELHAFGRERAAPMSARPAFAVPTTSGELFPPANAVVSAPPMRSNDPAENTGWGADADVIESGQPAPFFPQDAAQHSQSPWGSVPNNLAGDGVADTERALEIRTLWGSSVIDTLTVTDQPVVTMGDERHVRGFGPFQKVIRCDIEVPSQGLPQKSFSFAESEGSAGTNYSLNIPNSFGGRVERANGSALALDEMRKDGRIFESSDQPNAARYRLKPAETLILEHGPIAFQVRYIRRARVIPPGIMEELNYAWLNILLLAFFIHAMAIASFVASPKTQAELVEDLFKNPKRFAQYQLTPEEKKKRQAQGDMLKKLKAGEAGARAKGDEGKAGRKDYTEKKQGRMAVKGDPDKKELAKSALQKLFGAKGNVGRSYLFGTGGLGGELAGALGGVTGAEIGDAAGLGGLGTRGTGPGGGGLSMDSVGLGALGTHGRGGGGGTGYGEGAGGLGKKADRDINISAGSPIIEGSLDKEIIRRIIKQHIAQIRYCYEKELVRSPGLFGKVGVQFTIAGSGRVDTVKVSESTLGNADVEQCIAGKIRTWEFPKPKGGGVVIVKYPFIFKTTG